MRHPALTTRDRAEQTAAEQALAADPAGRLARNAARLRLPTCTGCGEYWPCSVARNRRSYRPSIAVQHTPDCDLQTLYEMDLIDENGRRLGEA